MPEAEKTLKLNGMEVKVCDLLLPKDFLGIYTSEPITLGEVYFNSAPVGVEHDVSLSNVTLRKIENVDWDDMIVMDSVTRDLKVTNSVDWRKLYLCEPQSPEIVRLTHSKFEALRKYQSQYGIRFRRDRYNHRWLINDMIVEFIEEASHDRD